MKKIVFFLLACLTANMHCMEQQIFAGAETGDILGNSQDELMGYPVLHQAVLDGNERLVKFLLGTGINVNVKESLSALMYASRKGYTGIVKHLLKAGADVHAVDECGQTALMFASGGCAPKETVELLINAGALVNQSNVYGDTALYFACSSGKTDTVQLLLDNGALMDVATRDVWPVKMGSSKAHLIDLPEAAHVGNEKLVWLLLNGGVDADHRDSDDRTALMRASRNGHLKIVNLLLDCGADINASDNYWQTSLMFASGCSSKEMVKFLLSVGAKINQVTKVGNTALHFACVNGKQEIVELLLDEGADINHKNNNGETALQLASEKGHKEIAQLFPYAGASV